MKTSVLNTEFSCVLLWWPQTQSQTISNAQGESLKTKGGDQRKLPALERLAASGSGSLGSGLPGHELLCDPGWVTRPLKASVSWYVNLLVWPSHLINIRAHQERMQNSPGTVTETLPDPWYYFTRRSQKRQVSEPWTEPLGLRKRESRKISLSERAEKVGGWERLDIKSLERLALNTPDGVCHGLSGLPIACDGDVYIHVNIHGKIISFLKQGSLMFRAHLSLLSRDSHMQKCAFFTDLTRLPKKYAKRRHVLNELMCFRFCNPA